ncbi:hypothetical protein DFJ63DRAFT_285450 [Scheffersomyces coipomensis]|uniref:uncharacterized protein n=1 Tax=Scheffersomyces coipomensis TaxID=1788519 RepID=UPI00315C9624
MPSTIPPSPPVISTSPPFTNQENNNGDSSSTNSSAGPVSSGGGRFSPTSSSSNNTRHHNNFLSSLLQKSVTRSRENSITSTLDDNTITNPSSSNEDSNLTLKSLPFKSPSSDPSVSSTSTITSLNHHYINSLRSSHSASPVKETNRVFLEFDPITKRKVLNTFEILKEIGRGEHGKVKLAKDLINNELVAIKIVNRKSKRDKASNLRSSLKPLNDYELKIKREIAIMKKCNHKYIVKLREVLDDLNSYKIYLVLEYLEKGEIKWKRLKSDPPINITIPEDSTTIIPSSHPDEIPCCGSNQQHVLFQHHHNHHRRSISHEDENLLSDEFSPNLTFKQSRKIFRNVLLGLEYLHIQGIVHRDIKPANLLVSSDNIVKISDFGVSFASSLNETDDGYLVNEYDLAKTAGTPAFFAPELCQTNFSSTSSTSPSLPKIDYKIDIWALGITLYCLLFGKVPFNADSEFELFQVIVNESLKFPDHKDSFNSPAQVTDLEFDYAKDLLSKLLDKDSTTRIEIKDIKAHPFTLMDLEDDIEGLHELLHLNADEDEIYDLNFDLISQNITSQDINNAVIGIGSRITRSLVKAIKAGGLKDSEIKNKFAALQIEHSRSTSSDDSSGSNSQHNSSTRLTNGLLRNDNNNHSFILSEGFQMGPTLPLSTATSVLKHDNSSHTSSAPHVPSTLSQQTSLQATPTQSQQSTLSRSSSLSIAGIREGRSILHDMIESHAGGSNPSSRRGSSVGIVEAPRIETKRNVGGDLYLRNQSVVETFKDIQQQDDKNRRKSSLLSSTNSNPSTAKNSIASQMESTKLASRQSSNNIPKYTSQLRVGPISILEDSERRPSSVMSLPSNGSFASLDSINDDYLCLKYQEYTKSRQELKNSRNEGVAPKVSHNHTHSDTKVFTHPDDIELSEKFKSFDLGSSMKSPGLIDENLIAGHGHEDEDEDENDPKSSIPLTKFESSSSYSSYSSTRSSSNDDDDDDEEDDEEEGDLTLAFSSKVTPLSRPKLFTLDHRARSHESNLHGLGHQTNQPPPTYEVPFIFQHQGNEPEFEDLPEDLMTNVHRPSIAVAAGARLMVPSDSLTTSNGSTTTLQGADYTNLPARILSPDLPSSPLVHSQSVGSPQPIQLPSAITERISKQVRVSSPLTTVIANSSSVATGTTFKKKHNLGLRENIFNNQFNNHYKKDPIYSPFPTAIHLDNDKDALVKATTQKHNEHRPNYYRSNSITVGLLQHEREERSL